MTEQPVYWTLQDNSKEGGGLLLRDWMEETKGKLLEELGWHMPEYIALNLNIVKVRLVKVTKDD